MASIKMIPEEEATGRVKEIYDEHFILRFM
jgi:hypothetical protein